MHLANGWNRTDAVESSDDNNIKKFNASVGTVYSRYWFVKKGASARMEERVLSCAK